MDGFGSGYGTFSPYSKRIRLDSFWPDAYLDYTESFALPITNPKTGIADPVVSLSLTVSPSGTGELTVSRLTVDATGLCATWWGTGGVPGRNYKLNLTGTTVAGRQIPWKFSQQCAPDDAVWPLPPAPNPGPGTPITWTANGTLTAFGGYLGLSTLGTWPTSDAGLLPGSLFAASMPAPAYIYAVPGFGPVVKPPVFFNAISGAALLALGAVGLPQTDPHVPDQIWINGAIACVSQG
jgi:hypothetical protein